LRDHLVDPSHNLEASVFAFESAEDFKVLSYSELREENIVLWANAKVFSEFVHVAKYLKPVDCGLAFCRV
jgi:hypothetical protein